MICLDALDDRIKIWRGVIAGSQYERWDRRCGKIRRFLLLRWRRRRGGAWRHDCRNFRFSILSVFSSWIPLRLGISDNGANTSIVAVYDWRWRGGKSPRVAVSCLLWWWVRKAGVNWACYTRTSWCQPSLIRPALGIRIRYLDIFVGYQKARLSNSCCCLCKGWIRW